MKKYIVRADFYPNGKVIPLGITDEKGNTMFINKVISDKHIGLNGHCIQCEVNNKPFHLILKDNKWFCVDESIR